MAPAHLVVVPLGTAAPSGVIAALRRLERAGALVQCDAVVVTKRSDSSLEVTAVATESPGGWAFDTEAWTSLFGAVIGRRDLEARLVGSGVSASFLQEMRHRIRGCSTFLTLLAAHLHPGVIVEELDRFPGTQLIYGPLPRQALAVVRAAAHPEEAPAE